MRTVRTFDTEVLQAHHQNAPPLDLSWLSKPSRHQFRWRCTRNRWHTSRRQIRSGEVLSKNTIRNTPRDMYVSTSAWLNPVDLPKIKDTKVPHPVMIDHLIVFDIDIPPFSRLNMERARQATVNLLDWIESRYDFERVHIVFSGSKGFHLVYREKDRTMFGIPDPRKREHAVREARKTLLKEVMEAGHPVDSGITADTRRIIRLPGSIHGSTGWYCSTVTEDRLRKPFKKWMKEMPRHAQAIKMPRKGKTKSIQKRQNMRDDVDPPSFASIELSTHVPGTKDRNAVVAWLPRSWGSIENTVEKARSMIEEKALGPALFWTDGEAVLMMLPRAFPRQQASKINRRLGLLRTALALEANDHNWVRASPRRWEDTGWESSLEPVGILAHENEKEHHTPWSKAHIEMARRLNQPLDIGTQASSGAEEPSIRIVTRK